MKGIQAYTSTEELLGLDASIVCFNVILMTPSGRDVLHHAGPGMMVWQNVNWLLGNSLTMPWHERKLRHNMTKFTMSFCMNQTSFEVPQRYKHIHPSWMVVLCIFPYIGSCAIHSSPGAIWRFAKRLPMNTNHGNFGSNGLRLAGGMDLLASKEGAQNEDPSGIHPFVRPKGGSTTSLTNMPRSSSDMFWPNPIMSANARTFSPSTKYPHSFWSSLTMPAQYDNKSLADELSVSFNEQSKSSTLCSSKHTFKMPHPVCTRNCPKVNGTGKGDACQMAGWSFCSPMYLRTTVNLRYVRHTLRGNDTQGRFPAACAHFLERSRSTDASLPPTMRHMSNPFALSAAVYRKIFTFCMMVSPASRTFEDL